VLLGAVLEGAHHLQHRAPSFNDAAFTFDPPEGAKRIVFADASAAAGAVKK